MRKNFEVAKIIKKLGENADSNEVEVINALKEMIGSKIVNAGFIEETEGRIAIDFEKDKKTMRLVLGYNELGEWVKFFGEKK